MGTQVFDGSCLEDMEKFLPKKFTLDLRAARKEAKQWDDAVPDDIRYKWVQNFWRLEKLSQNAIECYLH